MLVLTQVEKTLTKLMLEIQGSQDAVHKYKTESTVSSCFKGIYIILYIKAYIIYNKCIYIYLIFPGAAERGGEAPAISPAD